MKPRPISAKCISLSHGLFLSDIWESVELQVLTVKLSPPTRTRMFVRRAHNIGLGPTQMYKSALYSLHCKNVLILMRETVSSTAPFTKWCRLLSKTLLWTLFIFNASEYFFFRRTFCVGFFFYLDLVFFLLSM